MVPHGHWKHVDLGLDLIAQGLSLLESDRCACQVTDAQNGCRRVASVLALGTDHKGCSLQVNNMGMTRGLQPCILACRGVADVLALGTDH
eukprot:1159440-Pelagomonas_calceolata.AAC.5